MAEDFRVGFSVVTSMSWVWDVGTCLPTTSGMASLGGAKSIADSCNFPSLAGGCKD